MAEEERLASVSKPACKPGPSSACSSAFRSPLYRVTEPDALGRLVRLMCLTPFVCALVLGPMLAFRRATQRPTLTPLTSW